MNSAMQLNNFSLRVSADGACVEPSAWRMALYGFICLNFKTDNKLNMVFTDVTDKTRVHRKCRIKFD